MGIVLSLNGSKYFVRYNMKKLYVFEKVLKTFY